MAEAVGWGDEVAVEVSAGYPEAGKVGSSSAEGENLRWSQ